jgi:hypothetical protein
MLSVKNTFPNNKLLVSSPNVGEVELANYSCFKKGYFEHAAFTINSTNFKG